MLEQVPYHPGVWRPIAPKAVVGPAPRPSRFAWPRPDGRVRVGFWGACYYAIGGTEVWHRTLLPRLERVQVVGFATPTLEPRAPSLSCPMGGTEAAMRDLAAHCDVLVSWGLGADLVRILEGVTPRPRVLYVSHGDGEWTRDLARHAAPAVDRFAAVSRRATRWMPDPAAAVVIPNTVDPARVATTLTQAEARRELGIEEGARVVLYVGRVAAEKRPWLVAEAVSEHLAAPWLCLICGDGREHARCTGRDRVQYLGRRQDIATCLRAADCLVVPSDQEGFCLAAVEAWVANVPVLATPVGVLAGRPELARIVPVEAGPEAWAAALEADRLDATGTVERAARARAAALTEFRIEVHVQAWEDLFLSMVSGRPAPRETTVARVESLPCPDRGPKAPSPCGCRYQCLRHGQVVRLSTCAACLAGELD